MGITNLKICGNPDNQINYINLVNNSIIIIINITRTYYQLANISPS